MNPLAATDLSHRWYRAAVWAACGGVLLGYLAGLGDFILLDVDEPKFVSAAREMARGGDAIVPHFNGDERFDKPILIYWLQAVCMLVFGENEFAARLPSAFAAAMTLPVIALGIAPRFGLGRQGSVLAALGVATSLDAQVMARGATADAWLLLTVTVLAALQLRVFFGSRRWYDHLAVWVVGAIAFLVKGPPALVAPLSLALGMLSAGYRPSLLRVSGGFLLASGLVLAWAVPALIRSEGRFWTVGVLHHVVDRSLRPFEGHGGYAPWWYLFYVVAIPLATLPFSPFLCKLRDVRWSQVFAVPGSRILLLWWFGGVFVVFTLVTSKLPHYPLPAFPPLMILVMLAVQQAAAAGRRSVVTDRWIAGFLIACGVLVPAAIVGMFVGFGMVVPAGAVQTGAAFALGWCWSGLRAARGELWPAAWGAAVTSALGFAMLSSLCLPVFFARGAAASARALRPTVFPPGVRVYQYHVVMPSLTYYLDRVIRTLRDDGPSGSAGAALARVDEPGALVVADRRRIDELFAALDQVPAQTRPRVRAALEKPLASIRGFLPSKGRMVDFVVLGTATAPQPPNSRAPNSSTPDSRTPKSRTPKSIPRAPKPNATKSPGVAPR